jgi:hypothetical protein
LALSLQREGMNEKESRRDDDGPFCLDSWLRQSGKRRYGYGFAALKNRAKAKKVNYKVEKNVSS